MTTAPSALHASTRTLNPQPTKPEHNTMASNLPDAATLPAIPKASELPTIEAPIRTSHAEVEHGQSRPDPYRWMHDTKHPKLRSLIDQAKAHEAEFFKPIKDLKQSIVDRMVALTNEHHKQVPWKEGAFKYFSKRVAGQEHPYFYRFPLDAPDQETLMLDNNALAKGQDYCEVNTWSPSPDGKTIAYLIDEDGTQTMSIALASTDDNANPVTDVAQLQYLSTDGNDKIKTFSNIVWSPDAEGFYYAPLNDRQNPDRVMHYDISTGKSTELYKETDTERWVGISESSDESTLLIDSGTSDSSKHYMLTMGSTTPSACQSLHAAQDHLTLSIDTDEKHYYILASENGENHKLLRLDRSAQTFDLTAAETLIPADEKNELEWIALQANHVLLGKRVDGVVQVHVYDKDNNTQKTDTSQPGTSSLGKIINLATSKNSSITDLSAQGLLNGRVINFPDTQYDIGIGSDDYKDHKLQISYESPTTPRTDFEFDCVDNTLSTIQQDSFLDFSPSNYRSEMQFATARDGTLIPVSLFYHKDTPRDGSAPLQLSTYGAYGLHDDAGFSQAEVALADKGMVCATAHVRGGGIYGRQWYEAGKMQNKINTFTDTIDVGKWLVQENYTQPDKMALYGGSAGGLPVGYTLNHAPDLFSAIIADVPFVDVLTDMFDEDLPLTQEEWVEWGNPNDQSDYDYMKSYSPIDNVSEKAYPAVMIIGGVHDGQVPFRDPAKLFAHLQHYKTDDNPLVFHVNEKSGHHGDAGLYAALDASALKNAFALWMTGSAENTAPAKS